jgi:2-iminoacetate synthase ThiH
MPGTTPSGERAPAERRANATEQFAIADTRSPREVAEVIRGLGYEPVWKDWEAALTPGEDEAFPESLRAEACF